MYRLLLYFSTWLAEMKHPESVYLFLPLKNLRTFKCSTKNWKPPLNFNLDRLPKQLIIQDRIVFYDFGLHYSENKISRTSKKRGFFMSK